MNKKYYDGLLHDLGHINADDCRHIFVNIFGETCRDHECKECPFNTYKSFIEFMFKLKEECK